MGAGHSKTHVSPHHKKNGTKRALLVGCNYPNTKAELAGCFNDVQNWKELLTNYFGFDEANIKILVDVGEGYARSTGKNIKKELIRIVNTSKPGDIVFFQFSGHGVQVPADEDGDYEEDGMDEALCPSDLNLIVDDDLRDILSRLNEQVKFTMVSDCCHSGGMLDHQEIVISGEHGTATSRRMKFRDRGISVDEILAESDSLTSTKEKKNREIDLDTMAGMLQEQKVDDASTNAHNIRSTLFNIHGEDASNAALSVNKRDLDPQKTEHIHYVAPGKKPPVGEQTDPNKGILITGCQSHETSADVTGLDGRSFGALSHSVMRIVSRHKKKNGESPITNYEVVVKVRQLLTKSGFEQNPCLECSSENARQNFILW